MNDLLDTLCIKDKPSPPRPAGIIGRPKRTTADRAEMRAIGQRLRWLREMFHLTQQEIADSVGLTRASWCHYERGIRLPDQFEVVRMAGRLGITVDYLLSGDLSKLPPLLATALALQHPELAARQDTAPDRDRRRA